MPPSRSHSQATDVLGAMSRMDVPNPRRVTRVESPNHRA
jgi:hypothetical protein